MIKYETLINAYYWILDGTNQPVRLKLVGYSPSGTAGLFVPPCGYVLHEGYEIARKFSDIFRTKEEAEERSPTDLFSLVS